MSSRMSYRNWLAGVIVLIASAQALGAEIYDIDPRHTFSVFEYEHWGLSHQQGRFDSTRGFIEFTPETGIGKIDIEIDAASVNTGSASFDQLLRSADFFDVENHPTIVFTSSALRFDGDQMTEVEGDLTVKGITRPLTLTINRYRCRFILLYGMRACGANASASLLRSDFDLGRYIPFVGDRIDLYITVEAIQRPPPVEQ